MGVGEHSELIIEEQSRAELFTGRKSDQWLFKLRCEHAGLWLGVSS